MGDGIEYQLIVLCQGDITRRDAVEAAFGPRSAAAWLADGERDRLWRELQLARAGVGAETPEDEYCRLCREEGAADCSSCSKEFRVRDER